MIDEADYGDEENDENENNKIPFGAEDGEEEIYDQDEGGGEFGGEDEMNENIYGNEDDDAEYARGSEEGEIKKIADIAKVVEMSDGEIMEEGGDRESIKNSQEQND